MKLLEGRRHPRELFGGAGASTRGFWRGREIHAKLFGGAGVSTCVSWGVEHALPWVLWHKNNTFFFLCHNSVVLRVVLRGDGDGDDGDDDDAGDGDVDDGGGDGDGNVAMVTV